MWEKTKMMEKLCCSSMQSLVLALTQFSFCAKLRVFYVLFFDENWVCFFRLLFCFLFFFVVAELCASIMMENFFKEQVLSFVFCVYAFSFFFLLSLFTDAAAAIIDAFFLLLYIYKRTFLFLVLYMYSHVI